MPNMGRNFRCSSGSEKVVGISAGNFDAAAHLAALTGQSLDLPALRSRALTYRLQVQSQLPALPGVNDYIKTANRLGLRLAVASSSDRARVEGYLRQLGLLNEFDALICLEDVRHIKPAPDLFLKACDTLKLRKDELLILRGFPERHNWLRRAPGSGWWRSPTPSRFMIRMRGPACCSLPWRICHWKIC
jgi:hypothetical protein